jgi:PAS domain S-box-containing protein
VITALLLIPLAPKVIALTRLEEEVEQQRTDLTHERDERQRLERDLNNFFMLSNDMFCVLDTAGSFQRHNPAWQQTFGYSQDELQAGSFIDFVHVEDQANTLIALENLRDGSDVISFENRFIGNNGCYYWLQWNAVPVPGQGLIYAIARNISEQKATTAAVAEEKKLLQVTLHSIGEGVITTDAQGDIAYLNPVPRP